MPDNSFIFRTVCLHFIKDRAFYYNSGDAESFDLLDDDNTELLLNEIDNMNMWLYVKYKFNILNEAWSELSIKSDHQPCLNKIIMHMKKLNEKRKLKPTDGKTEGVQICFKETLTHRLINVIHTRWSRQPKLISTKGVRNNKERNKRSFNLQYIESRFDIYWLLN